MKTSAWRRPSTSIKPQSGRHPGRRRPVENLSMKTSVNYSYFHSKAELWTGWSTRIFKYLKKKIFWKSVSVLSILNTLNILYEKKKKTTAT